MLNRVKSPRRIFVRSDGSSNNNPQRNENIKTEELMLFAWPVKILFILTGKCPFTTIKNGTETKLITSYKMLFCSFLTNIILVCSVIWNFIEYPWPESNSIAVKAQNLNIVIWYTGSVLISWSTFFAINKQRQIYQEIYNIYTEATEIFNGDEGTNTKYKVFAITGSLFTYTAVYVGLCIYDLWDTWLFLVIALILASLEYLVTAIEIYCFQFIICEIINRCRNGLTSLNVKSVGDLYISLANVSSDFNDLYWPRILLLVVCAMTSIIVDTYEIGRSYVTSLTGHFEANGKSVSYILYIQVFVVIIVFLSSIGTKKYKQSQLLLLKARTLLTNSPTADKDDFDLLISGITDLSMDLSAGFFNINYSFFTTVTGNIITYMVILLQFPGADNNETKSAHQTIQPISN